MKSTPAPQFSEIRGSIGSVCVQKRKTGFAISKKPIPYSISGEERSIAQQEINTKYGKAVQIWQTLSAVRKALYDFLAAPEKISGENKIVELRIAKARYGTARYRISAFGLL